MYVRPLLEIIPRDNALQSGDRGGPFVALMSFCSPHAFLTAAPPCGSAQTLKSVA